MSKFKVGDLVRIKPRSEIHLNDQREDSATGVYFNENMEYLVTDEVHKVENVAGNGKYKISGNCWTWVDNWLVSADDGTKSMLKSGYLVEYRNGKLRLVVETGDDSFVLISNEGENCNDSTAYYDNLCSGKTATGTDIMRVYGLPNGVHFNSAWSKDARPLIWERKETKKMTVAEVCKALGYDVEIVKDGATDA